MQLLINSERKMQAFAKKIFKSISIPKIITLQGDLGVGKTTFTRFIAQAAGIQEPTTSPTFNLIQEYSSHQIKLIHADLYRLPKDSNLELLGFDEYFEDKKCLIIIEWADKFLNKLPTNRLDIQLKYINKNIREIKFNEKELR